jgi:hypothetical protein
MLSDEATPKNKAKVFGFLHALDIGGTLTAVTLLSVFLYITLKFNIIFSIHHPHYNFNIMHTFCQREIKPCKR